MLCCDSLLFQQLWLVHFDPYCPLSDLFPWRSAVARLSCCCVFWSWASTLLEFLFHYFCWCCQGEVLYVAPCKVIRIPESRKFLLVESGILGSGIQNPAFGIQDPAKKGIQNPLAENPFQIVLTAFTRIHATTVQCSSLTWSIGA